MTRKKAIHKAREAYWVYLTRGIHLEGFNHFGKGFVFVSGNWIVYLNPNGSVRSTIETKDMP